MSASPDILADPIVFIRDEHERQLEACHLLEELVNAPDNEPVAARAASLLKFVTEELQLHVEDEEQDLFPLLLKSNRDDSDL